MILVCGIFLMIMIIMSKWMRWLNMNKNRNMNMHKFKNRMKEAWTLQLAMAHQEVEKSHDKT